MEGEHPKCASSSASAGRGHTNLPLKLDIRRKCHLCRSNLVSLLKMHSPKWQEPGEQGLMGRQTCEVGVVWQSCQGKNGEEERQADKKISKRGGKKTLKIQAKLLLNFQKYS